MAVHGGKPKIRHKNMTDGVAENGGCHGGQKKNIHIYKLIEIEKNKRRLNRKKKLWCQIGKKNGTVKSKKRLSISKRKKKLQTQKKVSNSKNKTKKKLQLARTTSQRPRCSLPSCASSPPFVPVLVAAVRAGARRRPSCQCLSSPWGHRCWLSSAYGGSRLGEGVELLVGGGLRSD